MRNMYLYTNLKGNRDKRLIWILTKILVSLNVQVHVNISIPRICERICASFSTFDLIFFSPFPSRFLQNYKKEKSANDNFIHQPVELSEMHDTNVILLK